MANTLLTPDVIASQALATLYESTVMLPLVYTDVSSEFTAAKVGDTVTIRKPATFTANEFTRGSGITVQDATETGIPVVLNKIIDVSFEVTSEQLVLDLNSFTEQLLQPAMEAISQKVDKDILSLRSNITQVAGVGTVTDPANAAYDASLVWNRPEVLIEAGRLLDIKNVPERNRRAVTGPTTKAKWLNSDILKHADKSNSTDALRRASIGTDVFGFEAFQTQNVGQPKAVGAQVSGDPTTEIGVAFHPYAFAFVSAPLPAAPGSNSAVLSYKGLNLRITSDYSLERKATVFSIDTFYGVKTIDANRAVLLKGIDKV